MKKPDIFGLRSAAQDQIFSEDKKRIEFFRKYFNLNLNPFPEIGVPDSEVSAMAPIRDNDVKKVGDWLRTALRGRKLRVLFVKGQYGSGKSFLLRRIVSEVSEAFSGMGEQKPKIVYVYRPSFEAQALNRAILEEIGIDNIRKMTWMIIRQQLAIDLEPPRAPALDRLMKELIRSSRKGVPSTTLLDIAEIPALKNIFNLEENDDYRKFLVQFDKLKRNRKELRSYFTDLLSRGLRNMTSESSSGAFIDLLLSYEDTQAWQTLLNIKLPRRDRANFVRRFLQDLITLLKSDGYVYLFVVIDEFEQITETMLLSTKEQAEYAYTIMEIINQIDTGLGLIISMTAEGFDELKNIAPFADRILSQIELASLNQDEITMLVSYYLDQARTDQDDKQRIGIFPFSSEVIADVSDKLGPIGLGNTPRNVVQFFHNLLEECFYRGVSEINEQVVEDFIQHFRTRKSYFEEDNTG